MSKLEIQRAYRARRKELEKLREKARSCRKRDVRKTTIQLYRTDRQLEPTPAKRLPRQLPVLRSACPEQRPCPHVGCKWNLYLDVTRIGNITLNFPDIEPDEMTISCALDVACSGGVALERVAEIMNMTRERVRQIEVVALTKLRDSRKLLK